MKTITYVTESHITGDTKESAQIVVPKELEDVKGWINWLQSRVFGKHDPNAMVSVIDELKHVEQSKLDTETAAAALQDLKECISDPDKNPVVQIVEERASGVSKATRETERKLAQTEKYLQNIASQTQELLSQCEQKTEADAKIARETLSKIQKEIGEETSNQLTRNQEAMDVALRRVEEILKQCEMARVDVGPLHEELLSIKSDLESKLHQCDAILNTQSFWMRLRWLLRGHSNRAAFPR